MSLINRFAGRTEPVGVAVLRILRNREVAEARLASINQQLAWHQGEIQRLQECALISAKELDAIAIEIKGVSQ